METNPKKIFVGNLPYAATSSTLTKLFGRFGEIDGAKIVLDRTTNRSKVCSWPGHGFGKSDSYSYVMLGKWPCYPLLDGDFSIVHFDFHYIFIFMSITLHRICQ